MQKSPVFETETNERSLDMKNKLLTAIVFGLSINFCEAQITDLGTMVAPSVIKTLPSAGLKILEINSPMGFVLLDLDLSVYQLITFPSISGFSFWSGPYYVTEDLFDTDPNTIEYAMTMRAPGSNHNHFAVVRADGTVLFTAQFQSLFTLGSAFEPIFNTPDGARMVLTGSTDGMGSDYPTHFYSLPGTLPCLACDGTVSALGMNVGTEEEVATPSDLLAFPNPAGTEATITYSLPNGTAGGTLVLTTLSGAVAMRTAINGSGRMTITTADLAAGTYLYHVETDQGMVGSDRLVVVR